MADTAEETVRRAKMLASLMTTLGEKSGFSALEIAIATAMLRQAIRDASPLLTAGMDAFEEDQAGGRAASELHVKLNGRLS